MRVLVVGVALLTVGMLPGCSALRENHAACMGVVIGSGAVIGATAGGLISGLADYDNDTSAGTKNWIIGTSTGGGGIAGGLIGWGLSQAICEEPPPPPPPPAPVIRTPPPPPPPPTQRRGG